MKPTDEQLDALRIFASGESMVVEAGAGTGKTSTLRLLAYSTKRRGHYLAYNRAIASDIKGRLPDRCSSSTVHSLAFRAVGTRYKPRLDAPRMASREIARRLDIDRIVVPVPGGTKVLQDGFLGSLAMKAITRYCQTADQLPSAAHVPWIDGIDWPDAQGRRIGKNNAMIAQALEPALERAWIDIIRTDGALPFKHEHYLKIWALTEPYLPVDFIMLDEAQDANPVIAQVVALQDHAQRVYVGDANQAIYEFTGAVNAIEDMKKQGLRTGTLSHSFRFGQEIADEANEYLRQLAATIRLTGQHTMASTVGAFDGEPDVVLTRTNAQAIHEVLSAMSRGLVPYVVGGGTEVASFARGAQELQENSWTSHPELACFTSWAEVQRYAEEDPQGHELRLMVDLIDEFGVATIRKTLENMPKEHDADIVVSTAHKAKGREWNRVRIANDFAMAEPSPPELRLQYVAVTRARFALDNRALAQEATQPVVKVDQPLPLEQPAPLALPAAT